MFTTIASKLAFAACAAAVLLALGGAAPAWSQEEPAEPTPVDQLTDRQSQLADKFARLEDLMFKRAELERTSQPRRAELLRKAIEIGNEKHIRLQLETLATLLSQEKFARAIENQQVVADDLNELLELLLSENSADRLKSEQARIRGYIKELDRIIRHQRSLQSRTEGGSDTDRLAKEQGQVADKTDQLGRQIERNEGNPNDQGSQESRGNPSDGQSKNGEPKEDEPEDGEQKDGEPKDSDPKDGEPSPDGQQGSPSEGQPSEGQEGQPSEGPPQQGQPQQGQPGQPSQGQPQSGQDQQQQQDAMPARQRIEEAQRRMQEAQDKLEEAQREGAVEEQEKAREELEKAKAELEEILRQLREEEIERVLAMLEGRFRLMLELQLEVYEATKRLDKIPADRRTREVDIQAGRLSFDQRKIVVEADKALVLLREEGSSVAFPEVVDQMREDMQQVAERLAQTKIGVVTQGIEEDIIQTLEELIEALQQAQQDAEQRRQQPSQPSQPQDPALVDQIAELKMIKAMQLRVNQRTDRYSKLLEDVDDPAGQATDADLIDSLRRLGEREARIHAITRENVLGRNR